MASAALQPHDQAPLIALVEDDPIMGQSVADWLGLRGYRLHWLRNGADALTRLPSLQPDLVICDIRLPDTSGEDLHASLAPSLAGAPFLFITGFGEVEQAVRLMKAGAADYVTKPFDIELLLERIETLLSLRWRQTDGSELGVSPAIVKVERILRRVAGIDSTILLSGPSGSGKEVAARLAHFSGPRASRPFVAVNCAAIPGDLMESELFGHERGAFTGAHARHLGHVERAADGTLFLDEVAELPVFLQAKLLRLLQERAFSRVGGEQPLRSSARVIAATNADLGVRVGDGRFREDLFFRLNVIAIGIPSLAERPDDVLPLALRFAGEFSERFARECLGFTAAAEAVLKAYAFPGNIRELRNRVERAVALSDGPWIDVPDLFPERADAAREKNGVLTLAAAREEAERRLITRVLIDTQGDVPRAADRLDISRSTLFDKIRRLGIRG